VSRIAQNYCSVCGEKTVCCVPAGDNSSGFFTFLL